MPYTFKYTYSRAHAWWKFWVRGKWIVFINDRPAHILTGFSKREARDYVRTINQLGGFEA